MRARKFSRLSLHRKSIGFALRATSGASTVAKFFSISAPPTSLSSSSFRKHGNCAAGPRRRTPHHCPSCRRLHRRTHHDFRPPHLRSRTRHRARRFHRTRRRRPPLAHRQRRRTQRNFHARFHPPPPRTHQPRLGKPYPSRPPPLRANPPLALISHP